MSSSPSPNIATGIRPIVRRQLSAEVARKIQEMIAANGLKVGTRLPTERQLAEALSVSRGAVREGLQFLAGLEIVEMRQGSGIFVMKEQSVALIDPGLVPSEERRLLLKQTLVARRCIECQIIELAARSADAEALADLRAYLEYADSDPMSTKLAHSIDLTFERKIAAAAGNPYLVALQEEAHRYFRSVWEASALMPHEAAVRSEDHWRILSAIERRDESEAVRLMASHVDAQGLGEPQKD